VQVDTCQSESGRNQSCSRFAIWTDRFAVQKQFSIELPRPPTVQHLVHSGLIRAEQISNRLQVGCGGNDRTDIQVAVGPAVQPVTDSGSERVINREMT
jgi:hypothetical protein